MLDITSTCHPHPAVTGQVSWSPEEYEVLDLTGDGFMNMSPFSALAWFNSGNTLMRQSWRLLESSHISQVKGGPRTPPALFALGSQTLFLVCLYPAVTCSVSCCGYMKI